MEPVAWAILFGFCWLDAAVMSVYIKLGLSHGMSSKYGRVKIVGHTVAGAGLLLTGIAALLAYELGWSGLGSALSFAQGTCVVACAVGALALARHTSGYEGFNWLGYTLYSILLIAAGARVLAAAATGSTHACANRNRVPSPSGCDARVDVYDSWVLTHAFLFCRLCVTAVHKLSSHWLGEKARYSVGTAIATLIPLALTHGAAGAMLWYYSVLLCVIAEAAGVGRLVHVNFHTNIVTTRVETLPVRGPPSSTTHSQHHHKNMSNGPCPRLLRCLSRVRAPRLV